jgi:hypothetical protein
VALGEPRQREVVADGVRIRFSKSSAALCAGSAGQSVPTAHNTTVINEIITTTATAAYIRKTREELKVEDKCMARFIAYLPSFGGQ